MTTRAADSRLAASPGLDAGALARLRLADVAVIGTGLLGGAVSVHLALLGVSLALVDVGHVEAANLGNQALPAASVGQPKTAVRARQIAELNPECGLRSIAARVEDLGLAAFAGVDLLLSALDGRAARVRVNEVAWATGMPWVDCAVDGSGRWLRGTVTYYDPRRAGSPCYLCPYDARAVGDIAREGRGPGCPSWRRATIAPTPPTLQASAFGAVVAGFAAIWATRVLLGRDDDLLGRQLVVEGDRVPRLRLVERWRNQACIFGHRRLELAHTTAERLGDLLAAARADLGAAPEELVLHGRTLVQGVGCPRCGARRDLMRVAEACVDDDVRCGCGAEMVPALLSERLAAEAARRHAALGWRELGLPAAEVISVRAGERSASYVVNGRAGGTHER